MKLNFEITSCVLYMAILFVMCCFCFVICKKGAQKLKSSNPLLSGASIFSFVLSLTTFIIIICSNCDIHGMIKFNFSELAIGVISIITTFLIGWNIYTIIDVKSIRKDFEIWKSDTIKDVRKEVKKYVDEAIQETKEDMTRHFIVEETTLCKSYAESKEWDKVLPLFNNMANRYLTLAKHQNGDEVFGVSSFVESVAWAIDEIYKDKDSLQKYRSQIAGFMESFRTLWKYDDRIMTIYNDTKGKLR